MIIKRATQVGNPIIRRKSRPVISPVSRETQALVKNLVDSMRHHNLVGMAAPQIGVNLRVFVSEVRKTKNRSPKQADKLRIFINPRITKRSKRTVLGYEGCGSVAESGLFGEVKRAAGVTVTALDGKGKRFTLRAVGLLARIIQHESDHLDGRVFLDRHPNPKSFTGREEYLKK